MAKKVLIVFLLLVCLVALIHGQYQRVLQQRAELEASAQRNIAEECTEANERLNARLEKALAEAERQKRIAEKAMAELKRSK